MIDYKLKELLETFIAERTSDICIKNRNNEKYSEVEKKYKEQKTIMCKKYGNEDLNEFEELRAEMESIDYENLYVNGFIDAVKILYLK